MVVKIRDYGGDEGAGRLAGSCWFREIQTQKGSEDDTKTVWIECSNNTGTVRVEQESSYRGDGDKAKRVVYRRKGKQGTKKLFKRLERIWRTRSQKPESDIPNTAIESRTPDAQPSNPDQSSSKSRKASESAAVFESTDPRYALKLFVTISKKFPGYANLHVYQNPTRQHRFYTVAGEAAVRETEKFLAQLKELLANKS